MMASSVHEEVKDALANDYALKALEIIERTAEKDPANLRAKQQLAKTYSRLGVTLARVGRGDEAVRYLEKAVAGLRAIVEGATENRRFTHDLALALLRLGDARRDQGDARAALETLEGAVAVFTGLVAGDPADNQATRNLASAHESLARTHTELAATDDAARHREAARAHLRHAIDFLRRLEARNALSKFDRKSLESLQAAAEKAD